MVADITTLVNRTDWGTVDACPGCLNGPSFLTLDVFVNNAWRPLTLARWPNVPFDSGAGEFFEAR